VEVDGCAHIVVWAGLYAIATLWITVLFVSFVTVGFVDRVDERINERCYKKYTNPSPTVHTIPTLPYNFDPTNPPPSIAIVAPFTYAPALDAKNKQAPATSCGVPILPNGIPASILLLCSFSVCAIIFDSKGPHAKVFEVIFLFPR
jgi:hypothetical protein